MSHVACPRVVRDEVPRLDVQLLEVERSLPLQGQGSPWIAQRQHALFLPTDRVDELQTLKTVVVFGARLDRDLLQRRHPPVACRTQNLDVGRSIGEHLDEVLRVTVGSQAVGVGERDPIGIIALDLEPPLQHAVRPDLQVDRRPRPQREVAGHGGRPRMDLEQDPSADRRVHVPTVLVGPGREPRVFRVVVAHVDPLHLWRVQHGHVMLHRARHGRLDVVREILTGLQRRRVRAIHVLHRRGSRSPGVRHDQTRLVPRAQRRFTVDPRPHLQRCTPSDAGVAG